MKLIIEMDVEPFRSARYRDRYVARQITGQLSAAIHAWASPEGLLRPDASGPINMGFGGEIGRWKLEESA